MRTYEGDDMIQDQHQKGEVCELEECYVSVILIVDFLAKGNVEGGDQVGTDQTSNTSERLLAKANPRRVTDSKEDGLKVIDISKGSEMASE